MSTHAVQVITEVGAIDRPLDYLVPEGWATLDVGDRVRVPLQSRSVRGWVVGPATPDDTLKAVRTRLDGGVTPEVVDLARWAAGRWMAPTARFLGAASPHRLVRETPVAPVAPAVPALTDSAWDVAPGVVQVGPTADVLGVVATAYRACTTRRGSLIVVVPTEGWAQRLRHRLERRGVPVAGSEDAERVVAGWPVVVGTRSAVWAPVPVLGALVVLDADDPSLVSSAWPRWGATEVAQRRAELAGAPWWATTVVPPPALAVQVTRHETRPALWPAVRVIDRRRSDPHDGWLAAEAVRAAHQALATSEDVAVAVLLQRLGTGRLLACGRCGELYRCEVCGGAEVEQGEMVACRDEHAPRPAFCRHCGSTQVRRRRVGVQGLATAVAAQLAQPVSVVTSGARVEGLERVVVGTEALWSRVRRAALVVVADFDQYLLAPRADARREALLAVARAGRVVGGRGEGRGAVILQTRRSEDPVVRALESGDIDEVLDEEVATARQLGLAPFGATAVVRGPGAAAAATAAAALATALRVWAGPDDWTVWAPDGRVLRDALAAMALGAGVRIDVE